MSYNKLNCTFGGLVLDAIKLIRGKVTDALTVISGNRMAV